MKIFYKAAEVLHKLKELKIATTSELMRETDITYSQLQKYIKQFKKEGLIVREESNNKREKFYKLTKKGQIIADSIDRIKKQL